MHGLTVCCIFGMQEIGTSGGDEAYRFGGQIAAMELNDPTLASAANPETIKAAKSWLPPCLSYVSIRLYKNIL
ncbi:MAG: hypothetical protein ACLR5J_01755 [Lachnospiraceae bacterium]